MEFVAQAHAALSAGKPPMSKTLVPWKWLPYSQDKYVDICTQHVHPKYDSWKAVVGFWHCSHGPAGSCRSSQDALSYCLHILVECYQWFCHGNHVPVAMLVGNARRPQTSWKTVRIVCFIHALPTDWSTSGPCYHHINPWHSTFASMDITVSLSISQILYIGEKVINFPSVSFGDDVALLLLKWRNTFKFWAGLPIIQMCSDIEQLL